MSKDLTTSSVELHNFDDEGVGRLRLLPSVAFGVRAAVLSRVALPVGMIAAGILGSATASGVDESTGFAFMTTCCPPVTL